MTGLWSELFSSATSASCLCWWQLDLGRCSPRACRRVRDGPRPAVCVHAISELSFAGAAAGLLSGIGVVEGSLVGSLIGFGVHSVALSLVFMILLGLVTAVSVKIVGALLVLSVLVTPAAAALRVSASPLLGPVLSTLFAVVAMVGGIVPALGGSVPISPTSPPFPS
jgi:ABC 3 transport family